MISPFQFPLSMLRSNGVSIIHQNHPRSFQQKSQQQNRRSARTGGANGCKLLHPDPWTYPSVIYGIYGTYIMEYMENYGNSTVIDFFQVIPHGSSIAFCSFTHFTHGPCALYSGWWFQPFRKIWKSVGIMIPNIWIWKNQKCSKPPTSIYYLSSR